MLDDLDRVEWADLSKDFFSEAQVQGGPALLALVFLTNGVQFLAVAHALTGCGPFNWFDGRVYRMAPGDGHYDDWHDDWGDGRRVALSLNLNRRPYEGGHLHIRRADGQGPTIQVPNTNPGDAVLFRLSTEFVHRVDAVQGREPKTAFAGWFNNIEPDLLTRLHRLPGQPIA